MIKRPVSVEDGCDIRDADGEYVCSLIVPNLKTSEIANEIAAALNGPAEVERLKKWYNPPKCTFIPDKRMKDGGKWECNNDFDGTDEAKCPYGYSYIDAYDDSEVRVCALHDESDCSTPHPDCINATGDKGDV